MIFNRIINEPQHLLLKAISGSRAYNLNVATSDTDIKGIFVLPQKELYGLDYTEQVSNETNDEVYMEIGRFVELLCKNNPNILELLSTPQHAILFRHPLMDLIKAEDFLSKLCFDTFAGYAKTQIKKARGLNKKINKPLEQERKSPLDFCYVVKGNGSVSLKQWLAENNYNQEDCGLVNLPHFRNVYLVYHNEQLSAPGTDKVKAEYRLQIGRNIRPKNTGSGISYIISLLIVCLASKKGDVIIVENPEIHLHPKAQSYLVDFFIFIANSGRQLIIETHSDHLFNGVKVAISQSKIPVADVAVHFFRLGKDFVTEHVAIKINDEGHILNSVPDLFDQFTNDLKTLVGF